VFDNGILLTFCQADFKRQSSQSPPSVARITDMHHHAQPLNKIISSISSIFSNHNAIKLEKLSRVYKHTEIKHHTPEQAMDQ
jgi:hypothetical protein